MPRQYLIPDLIPKSTWFNNLRLILSQEEWDIIRKDAYRQAGYVCEICGGKGDEWPVECHERWRWDDLDKGESSNLGVGIQYLEGVQALCPNCHKVKHIGAATIRGGNEEYERCRAWMANINLWTTWEAERAIRGCFEVWRERSEKEWRINYNYAPPMIQMMVKAKIDARVARKEMREQARIKELEERKEAKDKSRALRESWERAKRFRKDEVNEEVEEAKLFDSNKSVFWVARSNLKQPSESNIGRFEVSQKLMKPQEQPVEKPKKQKPRITRRLNLED